VRGEASIKVSVLPNTTKIVAAYAMYTRATARFNGENTSILPRSLVWRTVAAHDVIQVVAEDALLIEVEVAQNSVRPAIPVAPTHAATGLGSAS
jgi:hypothetical protein